jgi:ElaB/YqjD/DUF883 family membrane-anchored ribosome-binding protein
MGSKHRKEIAKDLESLRRDVSSLADQLTGLLSDKGDDIAGDVKQRVQRIRDDIEEGISQASAKGRELAREAHLEGLGKTIENSVRERPFTMLAIAAGLGAVVASLLRR